MNNKSTKKTIILLFAIIYVVAYVLYIFPQYKEYAEYITAAFITLLAYVSFVFFGIQKDKPTELKKNIIITEIIIFLGFFSLYYGSGLFLGYLQSPYAFTIEALISNMLSVIVTFIGIEIFRYILICSDRENKLWRIATTTVICIFEITIYVIGQKIGNYEDLFKVTSQTAIPIITKNITLSYLVRYVGIKPVLLYRIVMDLYLYLVPIIPDLGDYFTSVVKIGLPIMLFIFSYRIIDDLVNGIEYDFKKPVIKKTDLPIILFLIIMGCLISGKFTFYLLGIGSNSMAPTIYKGDAVLLNKHQVEHYKKGDIVAYNSGKKIIIHRVVEVKKIKNKYHYKVKGDANNSKDNVDLTNSDIVGVVVIKFKYIGYPSVYLSELFSREI